MTDQLRNDVSVAAAQALLETVAHLLREEEHADALAEFGRIVYAALETAEVFSQREAMQCQPSPN